MSMKTFLLAAAAGAVLLSGPAMASEPVKLTENQMENVTAGLEYVRARFNISDVRVRNITSGNSDLVFDNMASDDTRADATTGFLAQVLVASSSANFFVNASSAGGNLRVDLTNWNQRSRIQY